MKEFLDILSSSLSTLIVLLCTYSILKFSESKTLKKMSIFITIISIVTLCIRIFI